MSSKTRRAGGKEKWVSANDYKFETPQRMPRKTRQGRHLSIPSPWMHKVNSQVKPGQSYATKKAPIKKSSSHVMKKRSQNKRVRIYLDEETIPKKQKWSSQSKIKQAVISLTDVKEAKDWAEEDYEMAFKSQAEHDSLDSQIVSKRRSASKACTESLTNGGSPKNKKSKIIHPAAEETIDATNDQFNSSDMMTNGDDDDLSHSSSSSTPLEEFTHLEEAISGELAKADLNADPKKTSPIPEAKPVKSWCSIA